MQEDVKQPQSVGVLLRTAREHANIGVVRFSQASGMSEKMIAALEADRLDEFPSEPYLRGFFRKYAEICGIEYDDIVAARQGARRTRTSGAGDELPKNRFRRSGSLPWRLVDIHPVTVIAALVLLYLAFQAVSLALPVRIAVDAPARSVGANPFALTGNVTGSVRVFTVNGQRIALDGGAFSYMLYLHPGPNVVDLYAENFFRHPTDVEKIIVYEVPSRSSGTAVPSANPTLSELTSAPSASSSGVVY